MDYEKTANLLWTAWERAANHEKLTFEETNAVRFSAEILDKIAQCGESLQELLRETETN